MHSAWYRKLTQVHASKNCALHRIIRAAGAFLLLLVLYCCSPPVDRTQTISGMILDERGYPVPEATVRVQATTWYATSGPYGHFTLAVPPSKKQLTLTAWAPGYYIAGPVLASPGEDQVRMALHPHATADHPGYQWVSSLAQNGQGENGACIACHSEAGSDLQGSLPVDEWLLDSHSSTARNPRFLTMYQGTDIHGSQSPLTRYVNKKDYGTEPLKPDPALPYHGPGYQLDFPDTPGNCASCHTPLAAMAAAGEASPLHLEGTAAEGIPCDFCHKIWDVRLDPTTALPYQNMPGVLSYQFRRPTQGQQFFAGPLDDVAPGEDTYSPLQNQSQFCAPCHYGIFWDVVIYDSYGEWLRSPYSDPDTGQTCQDCHMPRLGNQYIALPEVGGQARDPATLFSHRMPGASDIELLQNAVSMSVRASVEGSSLLVQVSLTNDQTGHSVPTDSPLRHLILLVGAEDQQGRPLKLEDGPRLPDWLGVGDPRSGYYAGQPGMVYAKVLAEQWTNKSPTAAYWQPTYLVSDNRLEPFRSDETRYTFHLPVPGPVRVHARLLYRRAFIELTEQKGWNLEDILMEWEVLDVVPE